MKQYLSYILLLVLFSMIGCVTTTNNNRDLQRYYELWQELIAINDKEIEVVISEASKAIELEPNNPVNYTLRGMAYDEISLYAKAISDGTKAIELAPELPFAYIVRGYAYSKGAAKHEMAIKDITRAIELEPSWDVFYLFRGEAYQRKDDHKSALIDFKKATTVNPSNPENYYILGRAWLQNEVRDKDKAILYITKGIKKDSDKKRADYYRNHLIVIETLYSK